MMNPRMRMNGSLMSNKPVVVIKIGSNALLDSSGALDRGFLRRMAKAITKIAAGGRHPVVVSSGAVANGLSKLGRVDRPSTLPERQALAAIGQAGLVQQWQQALLKFGVIGAQILLTADDFDDRARYLNLTATFRALFGMDAVPIVNENDTVAIEELALGENDRLSALLASQLEAERLIILSDVDGVYDRDPRSHADAQLLPEVQRVTNAMITAAGEAGSRGTGGMRSKLEAARIAARAGVDVFIASAKTKHLAACALGERAIGTHVTAHAGSPHSSRRRWLALARAVKGTVVVDGGAARALTSRGTSLLPAGIVGINGRFARGDTIAITDESGQELARGLTGLASDELEAIAGMRMDVAARRLGYALPKAAVHRDNLVLSD